MAVLTTQPSTRRICIESGEKLGQDFSARGVDFFKLSFRVINLENFGETYGIKLVVPPQLHQLFAEPPRGPRFVSDIPAEIVCIEFVDSGHNRLFSTVGFGWFKDNVCSIAWVQRRSQNSRLCNTAGRTALLYGRIACRKSRLSSTAGGTAFLREEAFHDVTQKT